ncbi:mechanosensitive ion channel [Chloroflexota bacterium]
MDWGIFTDPIESILTAILGNLTRIIGVLVLLLIAWILAKVLRAVTRKALRASRVDKMLGKGRPGGVDKMLGKGRYPEDTKQFPVAQGAGTVVFWLVWVFCLLAILQVLGLEGVLSSVVVLFEKIFAVIPNILGAVIVLVVFYVLAGLLARLVTNLLTSIQFNRVPVKLGLSQQVIEGEWSPSNIVGYFAAALVMVFSVIMATDMLGFAAVTTLVSKFMEFLALAILAVVILMIGIFLVNILAKMLQTSGLSPTLVLATRVFMMVFIIAIALSTLGIADDVILLGFGLILGSIALASAIAFGIGGREVAGDLLARWIKPEKSKKTHESDE